MPVWDPQQYARYGDERSRPFFELTARIQADQPSTVVDLGCGSGALTATLADRWPQARIEGVDSSPQMLERADAHTGRVRFVHGDISEWKPAEPVDVIVSNAALQWVPGHLELLPRFLDDLGPGGTLAFQVPGNFDYPSHVLLRELRQSPRWSDRLGKDSVRAGSHAPAEYLEVLARSGCHLDAWETTYQHVLTGPNPVLEWVKGSALRPVLDLLDADEAAEFEREYGTALRAAYPERDYGTIFPFRRIFVVARKD